mmetsp:Transcript_59871/g.133433  ORF Transcript_59871/g.133433 Transcript_59871/m.133433 type:complete len:240 (-) Transcript_59871:253-972(-)
MLGSSSPKALTCVIAPIASALLDPKPYSDRVGPTISVTMGISFIIFIMSACSPAPSHSFTAAASFSLFAGSLNVSRALVSSARAVSLVSFAGAEAVEADGAAAFFFAVRVLFHRLLFLDDSHPLSKKASSSSRVGYDARSFSSPASHFSDRPARHDWHAASSLSSHSASSSAVQVGNTICLATLSPLILMISMMKISVAPPGILGGFPLGPYAISMGMYISHLSPTTMSCMASVQPLMT